MNSVSRGAAILAFVLLLAGCGGDKTTSTSVRVAGIPTRRATEACLFLIRARIIGGGKQTTCLRKIDGFPDPRATIRSQGSMAFALPKGTIRTRVSIVQHFARDGVHAHQTLRGSIMGGTGIYRKARGTVSGTGTVIDRALSLGPINLRYALILR
jgi:hypothetical protein